MPICTKPCDNCPNLTCGWRGYSVDWRQGENEADRDIAEGRVKDFDSVEELIKHLHKKEGKKNENYNVGSF